MKVVLLKKVDKLGNAGDIKEVSAGFASNYLIPQGMAKPASENIIKQVEKQIAIQKEKDVQLEESYRKIAEKIEGKEYVIEKKAKEGKLFGSVKEKELADLIGEKEITEKSIIFASPVKELGEVEVKVRISGEVNAKVKLVVKALEEE